MVTLALGAGVAAVGLADALADADADALGEGVGEAAPLGVGAVGDAQPVPLVESR
jgi:hypothetical protein